MTRPISEYREALNDLECRAYGSDHEYAVLSAALDEVEHLREHVNYLARKCTQLEEALAPEETP